MVKSTFWKPQRVKNQIWKPFKTTYNTNKQCSKKKKYFCHITDYFSVLGPQHGIIALFLMLIFFVPVTSSWQMEYDSLQLEAFSGQPGAYHRTRRECDKYKWISNHYLYQDPEPTGFSISENVSQERQKRDTENGRNV